MEIAVIDKGDFEIVGSLQNDIELITRFAMTYTIEKESLLTDSLFKFPKSVYSELEDNLSHYEYVAVLDNNTIRNIIDNCETLADIFPVLFMEFIDEMAEQLDNEESLPEFIFLIF